MDYKVFKALEDIKIDSIKNQLDNLNFYEHENEDVSIFHCNRIQDNLYHIVFHIDEEFNTVSKYVKSISKMPVNMYINSFLFLDNKIICIENVYSEYFEIINNKIYEVISIKFKEVEFDQRYLREIIEKKSKKVLQYEYEDEDGIVYNLENKFDIDKSCLNQDKIYYINITANLDNYEDILISIKRNGQINVKANIPLVLIEILKYLLSGI